VALNLATTLLRLTVDTEGAFFAGKQVQPALPTCRGSTVKTTSKNENIRKS